MFGRPARPVRDRVVPERTTTTSSTPTSRWVDGRDAGRPTGDRRAPRAGRSRTGHAGRRATNNSATIEYRQRAGEADRRPRGPAAAGPRRSRQHAQAVRARGGAGAERAAERTHVINELLPVVDNLGRQLGKAGLGDTGERYRRGSRARLRRRYRVSAFPRFDDVGRPFDPARHEAVGTVEADAPAGTVVSDRAPRIRHRRRS